MTRVFGRFASIRSIHYKKGMSTGRGTMSVRTAATVRLRLRAPRTRSGAFLLAALSAVFSTTALADTVTLHNGDRLTGRILHMSPSTLTFETTWAGELKIPRYEVRGIETDKPIRVLRERAPGTETVMMKPGQPGQVLLVGAGDRAGPAGAVQPEDMVPPSAGAGAVAQVQPPRETVPLARLRYLNPKPEESGEGVSYQARVSLAGASARGGTVSDRLYAEGDLGARALDWRYALNGKFLRERDAEGTSAANWLLSGNVDRFLSDQSFLYARGSAEHDRFRDISRRMSLGVGYGRQILQTERTALSLRGGPEMIYERNLAGDTDTSPALGWGLNFSHRLDTLSAEFFHDQRGYHSFGGDTAWSVRSRTGLRVPLASGLTASLQLNLDWDDDRAGSGSDRTWLVGLGYTW